MLSAKNKCIYFKVKLKKMLITQDYFKDSREIERVFTNLTARRTLHNDC